MNNSIKRAQSQARLSFAERENFRPKVRQLKKTLLTLVALLAVTTGAWADETLVTIDASDYDMISSATSFSKEKDGITIAFSSAKKLASYFELQSGTTVTITSTVGKIKSVVFSCPAMGTAKYGPGCLGSPTAGQYSYIDMTGTWTGEAESFTLTSSDKVRFDLIYVTVGEAAAASGPKVAWNTAENTGTFTMPGGNVTLEPEYYPQAALTAAPTAINDVPATTDGAIVNAGTVANIGETANAQGTVMYFVSQTEMTDAALLALAADKWTADVPTAQSLAQGTAYVYYYIRGNDGDTDETTFSDGDILAANALTVNIAAEPTYAVTFADGVNPEPPAEPEWTASPATGVTKGQTVTVTYTGTKKVIGVKAEKKAKAAGPITVTWYNDDITGSGKSFTKDGVTITAESIDFDDKNFEDGTFTTTLGNFTKIEVTTADWQASGTGWSISTWTGNASSVSFSGNIYGNGSGNTKFVFTIEPTN